MKDALALALVHFLWQGAGLAVVAWALMRLAKTPSLRYAIGVTTLTAMLAAPVMTFLVLQPAARVNVQTTIGSNGLVSVARDRSPSTHGSAGSAAVPSESRSSGVIVPTTWILSVWAFGVALLSLRIAGGLVLAHRLAASSLTPVADDLQRLAARMAVRLNVRGVVRVCESASVAVPIMVGWLRPVIVMPPAALAGLPAAQLEALLAHEFAHIRRHDYLVNLLQTGVETLCFYHPAVWWVSREIRRHREHCCDDVAVGVCDRLTYVTALSALAAISTPQFALAATGGSLRDRVQRLIEPTTHLAATKGAWMAMLPILLVVSFVAPHAWGDQSVPAAAPVVTAVPVAAVVAVAGQTVQAKPVPAADPAVQIDIQRRNERRAAAVRVRPQVERPVRPANRTIEREVPVETRTRQVRAAQSADATRRTEETRTVLRARRVELGARTEQLAARQELQALETQLRRQEMTLDRSRQLVEKGLATQASRARAEEEVAHARRQLESARAHHALREQEHDLRRREVEVDRRAHAVNLTALDASATLQAQDQLTISIADEPDLPTHFTVRADGSIRFPLLGSVRVEGSTTTQVQAAIQKLIRDKGLAANPAVTVSARRGR